MKKILLLLCVLLCGAGGVWAGSSTTDTWSITSSDISQDNWVELTDVPAGVTKLSGLVENSFTPWYRDANITFENKSALEVTFTYTSGNHMLEILGVEIWDGTILVSKDYHYGTSGGNKWCNVYFLKNIPAGDYTLRYIINKGTISSSKGDITLLTIDDETEMAAAVAQSWIPELQEAYGAVTDASQYTSNAVQAGEGSIANLLDGAFITYFHSCWSNGPDEDHYLQADLGEGVTLDQFYFFGKKRHNENNSRPTIITVSGSNDGTNFTDISTITKDDADNPLPTDASVTDYTSNKLGEAGTAYRYLRFTVTGTTKGSLCNGHIFFTFSEFYILPANDNVDKAVALMRKSATDLTSQDIADITALDASIDNASRTINVTYHVLNASNVEVAIPTTIIQYVDGVPAVPEAKSGCTYTYYADAACTEELTAITSTTTDVYAKYTYTPAYPFKEFASFDKIDQWYYLRLGSSTYVTYNNMDDPNVCLPTAYAMGETNVQWAFIGSTDPYTGTGLTIVNRAAGEGYVLSSNSPKNDGGTGQNTYATMTDGATDTYNVWYPSKSTYFEGGFFLATEDGDYLNFRSNENLAFWTNGHDAGSTFRVEEATDNYIDLVTAEIAPWYDTAGAGYFTLNAAGVKALKDAGYSATMTTCDLDTYYALKAVVTNPDNMLMPTEGYYRIKSYGSRTGETYIAYGQPVMKTPGLITIPTGEAMVDASTIIKLTAVEGGFTLTTQGLNVQAQTKVSTAFPATADEGITFTLVPSVEPGWCNIGSSASYADANKQGYFYELDWAVNGTGYAGVANWGTDSEHNRWVIEDATYLNIDLNEGGDGYYYATFCVPFDVTLSDVAAYTLTDEGAYLTPSEATEQVPAGTPVMLRSTADYLVAKIAADAAYAATPLATTGLTGSYLALTADAADGNYYLGTDGSVVGFYQWTGNVAANRAYVAKASEAKPINWGATAIQGVELTNESAVIYNLAGQRVNKAVKGIYIINGKKILK